MPSLWENYGKPTLTPLEGRKIKIYKIVTGFPEDPVRSYNVIESETYPVVRGSVVAIFHMELLNGGFKCKKNDYICSSASGSAQIALKMPPIERYAFSASKL